MHASARPQRHERAASQAHDRYVTNERYGRRYQKLPSMDVSCAGAAGEDGMADKALTTAAAPPAPPGTSPGRARLELLVVGAGALVVSLTQSLLVPVLAILPADLHTSAR